MIETRHDEVAGRDELAGAVLGGGVLFEDGEGAGRGGEVGGDHPPVATQERDERDALVGGHLEVPGGAVLAGCGLGGDELAAVERRPSLEEGFEGLALDLAGESQELGAAALPDASR